MGGSLWGPEERPWEGELSSPSPAAALQRLRGTTDVASELAELEEERAACQGLRARRPWELFLDGTLRRQVTSLVVLGSAMELCGNDSVRPLLRPPTTPATLAWGLGAAGPWEPRQCHRAGPAPTFPGVRLCFFRVPGGGSPPGEGPVCHHRDRVLRAAHGVRQRESGSGLVLHPPCGGGGPGALTP